MKKNVYLLLTASSAMLLASCSKMKLTSDNFTVSPTPLEYVAGEVPATININMPSKAMKKKATVECIPVLKWDGGSATGQSFTMQGEKVEANNTTISYKNGGNASMRFNVPFQSGMENSELYMTFNGKKGNKALNLPEVKIANGVISTGALAAATAKGYAVATDQFQRVIAQKQEAAIKFLINQSNLRGSELNSKTVQDFIETLKNIKSADQSLVLKNVEIAAYASPDGAYSFNENLANKRGQVSEKYLNEQMKKMQLDGNVDTKYTAEDWEGFQQLVAQSNLQDKNVILSVLSMYSDPEEREREIRNISTVYKDLAEAILPELRRARMIINYEVIGRTDDEIMSQFKNDPSKLSAEELVYAANKLAKTADEKQAILTRMAALYPNDSRAQNNLAVLAMEQGDNTTAKQYLEKALKQGGSAAEANINLGMLALQNGQVKEAETYIGKGATTDAYNAALGNLYLAQGKYNEAANKLAGSSASNSAALANILSKNYSEAKRILDNVKEPDATTAYLKAVLASRMGNQSDANKYLEQAKQLDSSYAKRALNDLEFSGNK